MKIKRVGSCVVALVLALAGALAAAEVDIDGAVPGKWTMDLDAAVKVAAERKLPILLNFSGSDWCVWCKAMEKMVFRQDSWKEYAKSNLVMVLIDFPEAEELVPEKYRRRNGALKEKFGAEGYPTYIVLDDDGQTVLGKLGAGEDKTPEIFRAELRQILRSRAAEIARYSRELSPADRDAYGKLMDGVAAARKSVREQEQQLAAARKKLAELQQQGAASEEKAVLFRVHKLGPDAVKEYGELQARLEQVRTKLADWMQTEPPRTQENMEKFKAMNREIQQLASKLREY